MPVSESPSPASNALNIAMELLAVIGLIGLGVLILGSQASRRGKWVLVLVVGIVAAFGILKLAATRWAQEMKKAPEQRSLVRRDIRDARQIVGQLRDCDRQILKLLAQGEWEGINLSPAVASNEQVLIRPQFWRVEQQGFTVTYEQLGLLDQNWDDWLGKPFPENESELKPWQREVNQKRSEIRAAEQQVQALIDQSKGR
jgi:hypothetical protein